MFTEYSFIIRIRNVLIHTLSLPSTDSDIRFPPPECTPVEARLVSKNSWLLYATSGCFFFLEKLKSSKVEITKNQKLLLTNMIETALSIAKITSYRKVAVEDA